MDNLHTMSDIDQQKVDSGARMHHDSILAMEALLDIKRRPSLQQARLFEKDNSSVSFSEPEAPNTTKISSSSKLSVAQAPVIASRTFSELKNEEIPISLGILSQGQSRNGVNGHSSKLLVPSPTLSSVSGSNLRSGIHLPPRQSSVNGKMQKRLIHPKQRQKRHLLQQAKNPLIPTLSNSSSIDSCATSSAINWGQYQVQETVSSATSLEIPKITGLVPNPLNPTPQGVLSSSSTDLSSVPLSYEGSVEKIPIIRATEVEAALRSKPQRGRKRENLTVFERLELTRTRNREHAKSTRIRKKLRYQELLDREKELLDHLKTLDLRKRRGECLMNLMKLRSKQINTKGWPDQLDFSKANTGSGRKLSSDDGSSTKTSSNGTASQPLHVQGHNDETTDNPPDLDKISLHDAFSHLIHDLNNFQVTLRNATIPREHTYKSNGLEKLREHDVNIQQHLLKRVGNTMAPKIQFVIPHNLREEIAFAENICYAQYNVVASISCPNNDGANTDAVCFSGMLRARFFPGSQKLTSLEIWSNISYDMDGTNGRANCSIGCSYPSVVSLDIPFGDHNDCHGHTYAHPPGSCNRNNERKGLQVPNGKSS